jgi:hypothetical protein
MPGEIVVNLVSMKLCINCSSSNKVEQTSDRLYKVYKLSMRAYWHKHVLRHAGTMLTSRDEVSLRPMCLPVVCRNVLVLLELGGCELFRAAPKREMLCKMCACDSGWKSNFV